MSEAKADEILTTTDPKKFNGATFYTCDDDADALSYTDPDEAVEFALEAAYDPEAADPLPELIRAGAGDGTIEVYAYERTELPEGVPCLAPGAIVDQLLEALEEEYGDPDGAGMNDPTPEMLAAAGALSAIIRSQYKPWHCEQVAKATVNVDAWVRKHRPDWLEPRAPRPAA